MKLWEVIKELTDDPTKVFERKERYKHWVMGTDIVGGAISGETYYFMLDCDGEDSYGDAGHFSGNLANNEDDWQLVRHRKESNMELAKENEKGEKKMDKKQRLEQIKNDIKKMKDVLSEERECMEEVNQEIYDAEVTQRELKEQIKTTEFWLEKLTRDQWELEKEIEEAKKPKTIWDLEKDDEHYWVSGTGGVVHDTWFGYLDQNKRRDIGNAFLTQKEAEDEVRARKLIVKAKRSEGNRGFVRGILNICIHDTGYEISTGDMYNLEYRPELGYWGRAEDAEAFLDENREELKWYFTEYHR